MGQCSAAEYRQGSLLCHWSSLCRKTYCGGFTRKGHCFIFDLFPYYQSKEEATWSTHACLPWKWLINQHQCASCLENGPPNWVQPTNGKKIFFSEGHYTSLQFPFYESVHISLCIKYAEQFKQILWLLNLFLKIELGSSPGNYMTTQHIGTLVAETSGVFIYVYIYVRSVCVWASLIQ